MPKLRRTIALTAATIALAGGASLATAGAAFANTNGLGTTNCNGWVSWDANHVTGYTYSYNGTLCVVSITQNGGSYRDAGTTGGTVHTPTYWRGWSSAGPWLSDTVCVYDYGTGENPCSTP